MARAKNSIYLTIISWGHIHLNTRPSVRQPQFDADAWSAAGGWSGLPGWVQSCRGKGTRGVIDVFGEEPQHLFERYDLSQDQAAFSGNDLQKTLRFLFTYKCSEIEMNIPLECSSKCNFFSSIGRLLILLFCIITRCNERVELLQRSNILWCPYY